MQCLGGLRRLNRNKVASLLKIFRNPFLCCFNINWLYSQCLCKDNNYGAFITRLRLSAFKKNLNSNYLCSNLSNFNYKLQTESQQQHLALYMECHLRSVAIMIEVTSRHMECTYFNLNSGQMPAVALQW